jgi:type I restriction enzyme, S subunit
LSWQTRPINEVCLYAVDCPNRTAPVVDFETPYKMLRTTNVRGGFVDTRDLRFVTEETYIKWTRRLKPAIGDVILTREAPLGDVGRLTSDEPVFLGQRLFHYRANPTVLDAKFLAYVLQSKQVQGWIKGAGLGATVQHAKVADFLRIPIPIPPMETQRQIGEILSAYDDLIENNRRRIVLLEEAARQLYKEWFIRLRFPGHARAKMVDGVPEGWERCELGTVVNVIKETASPKDLDPDTPYIGLEHLPRRSITLSDWEGAEKVESGKFRFKEADIIFGRIRPYFHKVGFAINDGITSSDAMVIRPKLAEHWSMVLSELSSDRFVSLASQTVKEGSKMPRANWDVLKKQALLLPPKIILDSFSTHVQAITLQTKALSLTNKNLARARDLLLPKLMSGNLAV